MSSLHGWLHGRAFTGVDTFLEDGQVSVSALRTGLKRLSSNPLHPTCRSDIAQVWHFDHDIGKITRAALHNMGIDRTCMLG